MSFWKDPQYSSMRVLIIVVLVVIAGFFVFKYENTSKHLTGQVINASSATLVATASAVQTVDAENNFYPGTTYDGVNLDGNLTSLGGASSATVGMDYGATTAYGNSSPAAGLPPFVMTHTGSYTVFVNTIPCSTTIHYRATTSNSAGIAYGADKTFTTAACTHTISVINAGNTTTATAGGKITEISTPPTVTTYGSSAVTASSATLTGKLTNLGSASSVAVGFNYGITSSYGSTVFLTPAMTALGAFNKALTGLAACTTYYFQATATSSSGAANGAPMTFTTAGCGSSAPIVIIDDPVAGSITKTGVTLKGTLTSLGGAASVNVGFESLFSSASPSTLIPVPAATPSTRTSIGDFTTVVTGLTCGMTYYDADHAIIPGTPSTTVYSDGDGHFTTLPC